jgi:hypothetical protein
MRAFCQRRTETLKFELDVPESADSHPPKLNSFMREVFQPQGRSLPTL